MNEGLGADVLRDRAGKWHAQQAEVRGRRMAIRSPVARRVQYHFVAFRDPRDVFADHVDYARAVAAQGRGQGHAGVLAMRDEQFAVIDGSGADRDADLAGTGDRRLDIGDDGGLGTVRLVEIESLHGQPFLICTLVGAGHPRLSAWTPFPVRDVLSADRERACI
jgi:hypothetical protein